tara:strand:- start:531 stop:1328 length:798 start_codon:yes stop_codon:yes gene_type:complete
MSKNIYNFYTIEKFIDQPRGGKGKGSGSVGSGSTKVSMNRGSIRTTEAFSTNKLPDTIPPNRANPTISVQPTTGGKTGSNGGGPSNSKDGTNSTKANEPPKEGKGIEGPDGPVRGRDIQIDNGAKNRTGGPTDMRDGFGEPKKKTFSKVARETTGKFVKILGYGFLFHHLGLFDITDPLNRETEEEKCIRQCEEENDTDGEKLKECIETKCKDKGGDLIGGIVNVIIFVVVFIIIFNIGKKILKKKGKVGESSNDYDYDYDYDNY